MQQINMILKNNGHNFVKTCFGNDVKNLNLIVLKKYITRALYHRISTQHFAGENN